MRPRTAVAAVGALAVVAALGACGKNTGTGGSGIDNEDLKRENTGVIATDPKDSQGPAPAVAGAVKGGQLRIVKDSDYPFLDPQRNYTLQATALGHLFYRTLTAFREDGKGKLTLVGDLATNPGEDVNKDCTVWKYTLKSGLKFEDGTPIKAADVSYGISRAFDEAISDGATYVQDNLKGAENYKGPYSGDDKVPGIEIQGDNVLIFTMKAPYCDFPFAASMNTTVPVPKAQDKKEAYDDRPVASGPYKIKENKRGSHIILERNAQWDPATDPIRHDYPDEIYVETGPSQTQATERALASNGADAGMVAEDGVSPELVPQALAKPDQLINAPSGLVWRLEINNERIKDLKVRQAIAYAVDKKGILDTFGGDAGGALTHTVLPPSTIGYAQGKYPNPYDGGPNGNPEKAKELLGGQKVKLVLLARQIDDPYLKAANVVKTSLEKAGFEVVITPIVRANHNTMTKTRGNEFDIYFNGWQPDWPSAASTLPVLFYGKSIGGPGSKGNNNSAYFNEPSIDAEIERISKLDANAAAPEWIKLDEKITKDFCPVVPLFTARTFAVNGAKVGGVFNSDAIGQQVYYNAYIKQ
jgi:peptide/nickel transport system substrate-binding protein